MGTGKLGKLRSTTTVETLETAAAKQLRLRLEALERDHAGGVDAAGCMDAVSELRRECVAAGYLWSEGLTRDGTQFMFGLLVEGKPIRWYSADVETVRKTAGEVLRLLGE